MADMMLPKNLRDWNVTDSMAKDVTETQQLKPDAHKTSAESSKNVTQQYETASVPKDNLGAQNTNS